MSDSSRPMGHFAAAEAAGFFQAELEDTTITVRPKFVTSDQQCADFAGQVCGEETLIPSLRVGKLRFHRRGHTKMVSVSGKPKRQPKGKATAAALGEFLRSANGKVAAALMEPSILPAHIRARLNAALDKKFPTAATA